MEEEDDGLGELGGKGGLEETALPGRGPLDGEDIEDGKEGSEDSEGSEELLEETVPWLHGGGESARE